jgi:hypothetical protein
LSAGTFSDRIAELRERTGCREGDLRGSVKVDQIYAHYQHEHREFSHPRGGHAGYLQDPLMRRYRQYLQKVADGVLDDGGVAGMAGSMEDLAGEGGVGGNAPVELGDLRGSGHPMVSRGEDKSIYDRPPLAPRLSAEELKAKSRAVMAMREMMGLPVFFMHEGKIMVIPGHGPLNVIRRRGRR